MLSGFHPKHFFIFNPLGPTGKIFASHNMGILEAHWRRFCHIESQVVDSSYLFNNLYRKLSTKGRGPLMPIVVILRKLFLIAVFSGV